jgi:glycerate kinase
MGAELCEGAELVLDTIGFDELARDADLVVTGEGTVDATTLEGKAPGAVVRRCERLGVQCELFGGIVRDGVHAHALSGRRALAGEDLVQLGEELARGLVESA